MSTETHHQMVAVAAYYLAEKREFVELGAGEDWFKEIAAIDAMLHSQL